MARLLVIVAAGIGIRLGSGPKALVPLKGRPLLAWTLDALSPAAFDRTVVAAARDRIPDFERVSGGRARVVPGGETRTDSVRNGFAALAPSDDDIVAIHDAARPFVTAEEAAAVVGAAARMGAAIAAVPVVDTIKRVAAGRIVATVDRSDLFAAATPQAFRADLLRRALAAGQDATDEAALCETLGIPVAIVPVSRRSFKITTKEDLALAEAILAAQVVS